MCSGFCANNSKVRSKHTEHTATSNQKPKERASTSRTTALGVGWKLKKDFLSSVKVVCSEVLGCGFLVLTV